MEEQKQHEKIYCIFDSNKEDINSKLAEAFEIYLKENNKEELTKNLKEH